MNFTVQELLNESDRVSKALPVTLVGFLTVGSDARVYQTEGGHEAFIRVTDRRVAETLLRSVPAYGGGRHIYADRAEIVSAVEVVDGEIVLSRIVSITILRGQKWTVKFDENV